jgi:hypothetical protein
MVLDSGRNTTLGLVQAEMVQIAPGREVEHFQRIVAQRSDKTAAGRGDPPAF